MCSLCKVEIRTEFHSRFLLSTTLSVAIVVKSQALDPLIHEPHVSHVNFASAPRESERILCNNRSAARLTSQMLQLVK